MVARTSVISHALGSWAGSKCRTVNFVYIGLYCHQGYLCFSNTFSFFGKIAVIIVIFLFQFSKQTVIDCYLSFVENYKTSGKVIENALQTKSSVQRFIEVR